MDLHGMSKRINNLEQIHRRIGDQHDSIRAGVNLALLDPSASLNPETVLRLALVTSFQLAENLPDPIAAEATMARKEWKWSLRLPAKHPGINTRSLCKFREGFYASASARQEYQKLIEFLRQTGLYDGQGEEKLESLAAITLVCKVNRYHSLKLAMKSALSSLVVLRPEWMRKNALPYWYGRYGTGQLSLRGDASAAEMDEEAVRLGGDIQHLLSAVQAVGDVTLWNQPEIQELDFLFKREYVIDGNRLSWCAPSCQACSILMTPPARAHAPPL